MDVSLVWKTCVVLIMVSTRANGDCPEKIPCFLGLPANCKVPDCLAWVNVHTEKEKKSSTNTVHFNLAFNEITGDRYAGVAISMDQKMMHSFAVVCIKNDAGVKLQRFYLIGPGDITHILENDPANPIGTPKTEIVGGEVKCTFSLTMPVVYDIATFDAEDPIHILLAKGHAPQTDKFLDIHEDKIPSPFIVWKPPRVLRFPRGCNPKAKDGEKECLGIIDFTPGVRTTGVIRFTLKTKAIKGAKTYVAAGISHDKLMGHSFMVACIYSGGMDGDKDLQIVPLWVRSTSPASLPKVYEISKSLAADRVVNPIKVVDDKGYGSCNFRVVLPLTVELTEFTSNQRLYVIGAQGPGSILSPFVGQHEPNSRFASPFPIWVDPPTVPLDLNAPRICLPGRQCMSIPENCPRDRCLAFLSVMAGNDFIRWELEFRSTGSDAKGHYGAFAMTLAPNMTNALAFACILQDGAVAPGLTEFWIPGERDSVLTTMKKYDLAKDQPERESERLILNYNDGVTECSFGVKIPMTEQNVTFERDSPIYTLLAIGPWAVPDNASFVGIQKHEHKLASTFSAWDVMIDPEVDPGEGKGGKGEGEHGHGKNSSKSNSAVFPKTVWEPCWNLLIGVMVLFGIRKLSY